MKPSVNTIFKQHTPASFEQHALVVFNYQAKNNLVYKNYLHLLSIQVEDVKTTAQIPFIPIEFFKTHPLLSVTEPVQKIFTSSGTTATVPSRHFVTDLTIYEQSYNKAFQLFYGDVSKYCILALLPSYLEREGSSLIYMADDLIKKSKHPKSGFYLHNHDDLLKQLLTLEEEKQKTILLGVTYSLLDLAEIFQLKKHLPLQHTIIMETGGMKGKRKEMIREEVHELLCTSFGVNAIHSEYGMTELLSQAYSKGKGRFVCPPWMKVMIRATTDPFSILPYEQRGGINIIDLANINSCSFIATQDLGIVHNDESFEVLGRFDAGDLRGCNLLVQ